MSKIELLTPKEIATRQRIFGGHHRNHTIAIIEKLKQHRELDMEKYNVSIRVVYCDAMELETSPELDISDYSCDAFIAKICYVNDDSFRIDFTDGTTIVVHQGDWTSAPWVALMDVAKVRYLVEFAVEDLHGDSDIDESELFGIEWKVMADMVDITREITEVNKDGVS